MFVIDIIQNIEFCGLTIHDLDMEKRIIDVNKQLQRTSKMEYIIESTKTNAGTRKLPSARREQEKLNGVKEGKEKQTRRCSEWSEMMKQRSSP